MLQDAAWAVHQKNKQAVADAKKEAYVKKAMLLQTGRTQNNA